VGGDAVAVPVGGSPEEPKAYQLWTITAARDMPPVIEEKAVFTRPCNREGRIEAKATEKSGSAKEAQVAGLTSLRLARHNKRMLHFTLEAEGEEAWKLEAKR
jgi:hypothetical protein